MKLAKKLVLQTGSILLSGIIAAAVLYVIYFLWQPIANWYWNQKPAVGTDLFNSVSFTSYLLKHFTLPVNGWKYTMFSGNPWGSDYPFLYFYMILPLAKSFGIVKAVQVFALGSMFACIAFSFLLFSAVSKNRILAGILALAVGYSVNMYKGLVYAGGIPVFATQAFFPLVLYLVVKYMQSNNRRYLLFAGIASGISIMGHPQHFVNFIFPSVALLLVFSHHRKKYFTWSKIKDFFIYIAATVFISLVELYPLTRTTIRAYYQSLFTVKSTAPVAAAPPVKVDLAQLAWIKNQFYVSFSDTNGAFIKIIIICAIFFAVGIILSKTRIRDFINTFTIALVVGWTLLNIYLLSVGINIFQGGIEAWYKLFWAVPIALGLIASQLFGVFANSIPGRIQKSHLKFLTLFGLEILFGCIFLLAGLKYYAAYTNGIAQKLSDISVFSSTFPEVLNGRMSDAELADIKTKIKPQFLNDSPGDYRLYSNDQTLNLWWNSLFETPLARGYIDPPVESMDARWGLFWTDAAFGRGNKGGSSLAESFKVPDPVVENDIKFLLDWNAIKYLEGNHVSHQGYGGFASVLTTDEYIQKDEETTVVGGIQRDIKNPEKGIWNDSLIQKLHFYEVKDELVTPIHYATNAPAVMVIGGSDSFPTIMRDVAMLGLASKDIVVAEGPVFLDDVSLKSMQDFDALILYKYDTKNQSGSWGKVAKYIEDGGKVYVDTGAEVKESSTVDLPKGYSRYLPDIFPVKETKRGDLGSVWDADGSGDLFSGITASSFSDLVFDGKPWNVSYPPNKTDDLNDGTKVFLTLQGYPVLAQRDYGKGTLIWSGFNLPYHALYNYNMDEAKLFAQIIQTLAGAKGNDVASGVQWVSPEKRIISASGAKGVLVKEEDYPGWSATLKSDNYSTGLSIYKTGPTSPGYMYVRIPQRLQGSNYSVTFSYNGSTANWIVFIITILTLLVLLDLIILNGKMILPVFHHAGKKITKHVKAQWDKEDE